MNSKSPPPLKNWLKTLGIAGGTVLGASATSAAATPATGIGGNAGAAQQERGSLEIPSTTPLYVVINHEEQYSIWPARLAVPRGWKASSEPAPLRRTAQQIEPGDQRPFQVVINHEEQYSIWPADQPPPPGFEVRVGKCQPTDCVRSLEAISRPERPR